MLFGWFGRLRSWWQGRVDSKESCQALPIPPRAPIANKPLERVILTDGVSRTLFEDYRTHRRTARGQEEIGWVLLGLRQANEAVALAALPAGMQREAGVAHVRFNSEAQKLAYRILREKDKRLTIVGVVHTHPGNMRQPSGGDLEGDRRWVEQLRSGDAVFAIGTADADAEEQREHQQCFNELCFSWYALARGDARYRTLPVQVTLGPDLAKPLHTVWELLETHARVLNRLYRQLAGVRCEATGAESGPSLAVHISLPEPNQQLHLLLKEAQARYYWERGGALIAVDPHEPHVDRAVFLILAELAKEYALSPSETPTLVES